MKQLMDAFSKGVSMANIMITIINYASIAPIASRKICGG